MYHISSVSSFSESIRKFSKRLKLISVDFRLTSRKNNGKIFIHYCYSSDRGIISKSLFYTANSHLLNFRCLSDTGKPSIDDFCVESVFSYCDRSSEKPVHLPPNIPAYDYRIHLNEASSTKINELFFITKDLYVPGNFIALRAIISQANG